MVFLLVPRAGFEDNESPQIALAFRPNPRSFSSTVRDHHKAMCPTQFGTVGTFARVHTRMNCKSPLNAPLETFALGQCVPSWTLRKSLRQRGIESNWLVKGTTLICA